MNHDLLAHKRLIYVAAESGVSGIGDFADEFLGAVAPYFGTVETLRHGPPGESTAHDIRQGRLALAQLVGAGPSGSTVVHFELSGGAVVPFWTVPSARPAPVTGTVHDAPWPVWWPLRTRGVANRTLLHHGLHYPVQPVMAAVQRRVIGDSSLFVMTGAGARETRRRFPRARIIETEHHVPERPPIPAPAERPLAVGLFGHVYKGKGFDQLVALRETLDPSIAIRVAGRGTENLAPVDGVEILGPVDGAAEDAFFSSIRAMLLPYDKRSHYGTVYPASGVLMRAIAYRTPVVCSGYGALADYPETDGIIPVRGEIGDLAAVAADVIGDGVRLRALTAGVSGFAERAGIDQTVQPYLAEWVRLLSSGTR
ncbi:glycosyltransferase family 1 protein [Gordonia alkaliphila]|uniref:glycosyltransferase family 1 protein n=1 Tax=Gordonia alkaliphila TaxID=1053547 RepID=UPI001FF53A5F|nr:glycosyltransferase family 1 protein [Gordonia alkaliphila]MCK0438075.1 glycosyltransferase family 1 protein [Gordonia alkaliphila]